MTTVPLLDVNAQNLPLEGELTAAFTRVLRSGTFIGGPEVEALERECAAMLDVKHAIGCSSGTDAILLALMALGIGPGDEVLVPSFTFFATAGCVSRTGAIPVFVDSCAVCFNIDIQKIAGKITPRTKAIIPVHLFGQSADMDGVMAIAAERNLYVIEDAAQALGAAHRGNSCGSRGHFGTYSFFPSKNLGGFGDGGLLVSGDDGFAERARILRTHGSKPKYYHRVVGGNFRLDPVQAALLRVKLARYDTYTTGRRRNADYYTAQLGALKGVAPADPTRCGCPAEQESCLNRNGVRLVLPVATPHNSHIWNQYTLRVIGDGQREALRRHLSAAGIGTEIYYPLTMDMQDCFAHLPEASRSDCHMARRLAGEVLSLPIYPELTTAQLDAVIAAIAPWLAATTKPESPHAGAGQS